MTRPATARRYQDWQDSPAGRFALGRCQDLLRGLLSGWPRRSRSVLAMGSGSAEFVETLWEAGFDVTAQDSDAAYLDRARALLGARADFVLSTPDHLPFDDGAFDYAVAALALEFWEQPEAVLAEMKRLACCGVILLFPNSWSLFGLECRVRSGYPLCATARPLLRSPRSVMKLVRTVFGKNKRAWASVLPLTSGLWLEPPLLGPLIRPVTRRVNGTQMMQPVGAFAGLRLDFGPSYTGAPLLLRASEPAATLKS